MDKFSRGPLYGRRRFQEGPYVVWTGLVWWMGQGRGRVFKARECVGIIGSSGIR